MKITKRNFLKASGASLASLSITNSAFADSVTAKSPTRLNSLTEEVADISPQERMQRIQRAQQLMQQQNITALVLEPGAAMSYFSGVKWWRSERLTAFIIPKQGDAFVVCPFFEQPSIEESLTIAADIHVWQEHESPFQLIKKVLAKHKLNRGKLAFEHSVRYFVLSGLMNQLTRMSHESAEPITRACRMFKSPAEIRLMHKANEITLTAYQHVWQQLELGMTQSDVKQLMQQAQQQLGGKGAWTLALFNEASAYPHGTKQQQTIREGSTVLMDCGCNVYGYQSDISRTFIVGEASKKQRQIWQTVRQGQQIAFEQAQLGNSAGSVDEAVRAYYQRQGFGPDYTLPGLSHRTGHGIGMEGHESVNFVRGETQILKPGMCFSNEPGIYIPSKFGVRIEDCLYMTKSGPRWFTQPPSTIDQPLGKLVPL